MAFNKDHKDGVDKGRNVTKRLADMMSRRFPGVSYDLIKMFARIRIFFRLRQSNNEKQQKKREKAKADKKKKAQSRMAGTKVPRDIKKKQQFTN